MQESRFKLFSDPVHGFISVPKGLLLDLVEQPEVQRLRRIRQIGLGHLVFPGAEHTRFLHALGAMTLMQAALASLQEKGTQVSHEEQTAALAAALLHDIGHGPFSHTLEEHLIESFRHEAMSRVLIEHLNRRFEGALELTLEMFDGTYERGFFHHLVSGQLDVDRLDYLRRDSAYSGVVEGRVGAERLIKTLRVHPVAGEAGAQLVVEQKGIYAVENFLIARRLMFWQVYLHKTVVAGDLLLRAVFRRARTLARREGAGREALRTASPALLFFLERTVTADQLHHEDVREAYCALDDTDVIFSLKRWTEHPDRLLADLSRRFIHRRFFRLTVLPAPPSDEQAAAWREAVAAWLVEEHLADEEDAVQAAELYLHVGASHHGTYHSADEPILILGRDGVVRPFTEVADAVAFASLGGPIKRPYVCYPKAVPLELPPLLEDGA